VEELDNDRLAAWLSKFDGILVAPGFGERGIEGKIRSIKVVRENNIPFFGICLGMQCAAVEFARNVAGIEGASSTEVEPDTANPIIDLMPDQKGVTKKGGTMRLGAYACDLRRKSKASGAYGKLKISERHRHRYEFNNAYKESFEKLGLVASGVNPDTGLVEIIELRGHPYFVATQFHPELKSTVENPHPLFVAFVEACLEYKQQRQKLEMEKVS
jgi:CTP synthase